MCKICAKPTAIETISDHQDTTPLEYANNTQEILENPLDPDPGNGTDDGDLPDNFDNDEPDNN